MLHAASELFHIRLEHTCLIGDRHTDLWAAQKAGCQGILLDRFDESPLPFVSGESASVEKYSSLLNAVGQMEKDGRLTPFPYNTNERT